MWKVKEKIPISGTLFETWKDNLIYTQSNIVTVVDKELKVLQTHTARYTIYSTFLFNDELWIGGAQIEVINLENPTNGTFRAFDHDAIVAKFMLYRGFVISASYDKTLRVWEPTKKNCVRVIKVNAPVTCCEEWNRNIVIGAQNGLIKVLDLEGFVKQNLIGHKTQIFLFKVIDSFLFSSSSDDLKIWSDVGVCLKTLKFSVYPSFIDYVDGFLFVDLGGPYREIPGDYCSRKFIKWGDKIYVANRNECQRIEREGEKGKLDLRYLLAMTPITLDTHNEDIKGEWFIEILQTISKIEGYVSYVTLDKELNKFEYDPIVEEISRIENLQLEKIEFVKHPQQLKSFHASIEKVEIREESVDFQPNISIESHPEERIRVLQQLNLLASKVKHNRKIKIVKAWHGTNSEIAYNIMQQGFSSFGKKDAGWFGKGIYFSSSAKYATRYCSTQNPCLILCYIIVSNPYPVIKDDAQSASQLLFAGKGNYKNYGSHYVPVIPYGDDMTTKDYRPPNIGSEAKYDEIVIFQEDHILPCFIVHLKKKEIPSVPLGGYLNWTVNNVCEWLMTLHLSKDYTEIIKKEAIDGRVLALMGKSEFNEIGITAFGDFKKIEAGINQLKTTTGNSEEIIERQSIE